MERGFSLAGFVKAGQQIDSAMGVAIRLRSHFQRETKQS